MRYQQTAERITESLKMDKSVLAVILYGSLSDGVVWEKSDLNMVVIVRDDKVSGDTYHIDADGIVVELDAYSRTEFVTAIKYMNVAQRGGCCCSLPIPPGGQIMFCQDNSLQEFLEDLDIVGKADMEQALLRRACEMLYCLKKAEKCIRVYDDATHARFYLLELAKPLAEMEICLDLKAPSKEPLQQAAAINPSLMQRFFEYPMNNALDAEAVLSLIKETYEYLDSHLDVICRQLLRFISDSSEPKMVGAITDHFETDVIHLTEYLCEKGILNKAGVPLRITAKGRELVEGIAYFCIGAL
jgi:hypothetical protein